MVCELIAEEAGGRGEGTRDGTEERVLMFVDIARGLVVCCLQGVVCLGISRGSSVRSLR